MSQDLGRDVPGLEKLYARKLWADFSYPNLSRFSSGKLTEHVPPRIHHIFPALVKCLLELVMTTQGTLPY